MLVEFKRNGHVCPSFLYIKIPSTAAVWIFVGGNTMQAFYIDNASTKLFKNWLFAIHDMANLFCL